MLPAQAARTRAMREERVRQVLVMPGYVGVLVWEWAVQPGAGATELWAEGEGGMRGGTSREPWKGDGQQARMEASQSLAGTAGQDRLGTGVGAGELGEERRRKVGGEGCVREWQLLRGSKVQLAASPKLQAM